MDSSILGALIGGGAGCLIVWGATLIFFNISGRRRVKPREQVMNRIDQKAWQPLFGNPVSDWYRTWAWKPVHTLDRGYIWLRPYWRRRIYKKPFLHGGADFWWQNVVVMTYTYD